MSHAASVPSPTVVCVLGMHRSGTSVVSRLLNIVGVHLGSARAISQVGDDNPKGYWEHYPIALLNDEILARFGGRWDEPPTFPDGWVQSPEVADLKDKAREVLADFAGQALWGWKDPRTCLTLPFWQELVGPIRYVLPVRNPCEVVASLQRRDAMSAEQAERLWLAHVHAALTHSSGQRRMFVFYDDIISDCAAALARMAAFVGRPDAPEDSAVDGAVADFLEKTLRHHCISMEELAGDRRMSFAVKSLYLAVRGHAPRHTSGADSPGGEPALRAIHKTLDVFGDRALETWDRSATIAAERDALTHANHEQAATIAHLTGSVAHLTELVASRTLESERLAAEVEALAARVGVLSAACDALSASQRSGLESIARLASDLQRVTLDRDGLVRERETVVGMLDEIHASAAWEVVTRLRQAIVRLCPAGTRRRRAFDVVLRRIAPGQPPARSKAPAGPLTA